MESCHLASGRGRLKEEEEEEEEDVELRSLLVVKFQWMTLALVDDRKGIRPQNLITQLCFLHHSPFSFSSLRRTWWDGVNRMYAEEESRRKSVNPGSPERTAIKPACVCVSSYGISTIAASWLLCAKIINMEAHSIYRSINFYIMTRFLVEVCKQHLQ